MSDASTMMPNVYGRGLQRALDLKLKKLRLLLTADEDITTELDRIVCRLMKLALRTSKDHQSPPPTSWMQRKLLDLLSLTEKAIERRRKSLIENYPTAKAIGYDTINKKQYKIKNNDTVDKILNKYLMLTSDLGNENCVLKSEVHVTEDNLSVTSNEMEPYILEPNSTYGGLRVESMKSESKEELRLQITQAWVDDYDVDSPVNNMTSDVKSSDSNTSNDSQSGNIKSNRLCKLVRKKDRQVISSKTSKHIRKNKIKERKSINKLIKKVSEKHSSSGQLARNLSKKFEIFEYQSYTVDQSKKNSQEHHNLQSTSPKPIPRSLIELCYQDLTSEKNDRLMDYPVRHMNNDVAATKESLLIDIISEDNEETIALRRTIATEMGWNSDGLELEPLYETVINVTKDDSFDGDYVVPTKTVDSETIFLYDLNEPSTSKGIRHVNVDAQCGTDILAVCPTPSAVSSRINGSNMRELGIKIDDSFTKLQAHTNSADFGTVTDENILQYDVLPMFNKQCIKIKDSLTNVPKYVECSTMTGGSDLMLDADIKLLAPISKFINSEGSISDLSQRPLHCFINQSSIITSQKNSLTKHLRPKLSCCGIHVHSYRDRQVSEDVVFQGEWQRNGPKIVAKKSPYAQMTAARKHESLVKKKKNDSKENISSKLQDNKVIKIIEKKSLHRLNIRLNNTKQVAIPQVKTEQSIVNSSGKSIRQSRNVTKVSSKIVTSIITSKKINNTGAVTTISKPAAKSNNVKEHNKRFNNIVEKLCFDNTKKKIDFNLSKLNRITDSVIPKVKERTTLALKRSKSELKADLLKLKSEKQNNRTYFVFRNEIESSRSTNSSPNSKPLIKMNSSKNNITSPSQNSSPCSSRNSVVTVRALPLRTKPHGNTNNFTSLGNNNSGIISVEDNENGKNEKYIKKGKNSKITILGSKDNENMPETSTKHYCHKIDTDKTLKTCDKNQNVFMFQVSATADSPVSICCKKSDSAAIPFKNPNTKLIRNKNVDHCGRKVSPSSTKKKFSNDKCESSFFKEEDKYFIINADATQYDYATDHFKHFTRSSTPVLQKPSLSDGEDQNSYQENDTENILKQSKSKINAAMKKLIEERLSFIKKIEEDNVSDSETVILSRDDNEEILNETLSPVSYKTVLTNENTCNISGSDIEYALLNYSIESDVGSLTTATSYSGTQSMDTDQISFKSTETVAKYPPFNSKQNDLDSTLVPKDAENTVRDIFERKEQHVTKNSGGLLAVQVFSGFSMDGEAVGGDQPEYISLVNPETGSLSVEMTRQVTSEELLVSGRSSDTYESCYVEDDAYVPNWLFQVISQQQSEEIPEEEQEPEARDGDEPEYDANGNVVEAGFGAGVGAGDGRGMHSDQSQDSSGRGTSISSSDVSSGPQSEAILIDPSAFLGSVVNEVPIRIDATSTLPAESSDTSFRTVETMETDNEIQYNRGNVQRRSNRTACASDVDADISSLGTDAADSDN